MRRGCIKMQILLQPLRFIGIPPGRFVRSGRFAICRNIRKGLGQKSRRDRDWESHNPPNRGCRGLGWVQSFEERRLRVTKSHF